MTDSRRQRIITELISIFQKNTKLYGHKTDFGSNVFEWRTTDFQESELPGMNLKDTEETVEVVGQNHKYILTIELEIKVQASTSTAQAREVIADINTILGQNCTVGGLVHKIAPTQNELLDFEKVNRKFGTIVMRFEVEYATKAFNPYT